MAIVIIIQNYKWLMQFLHYTNVKNTVLQYRVGSTPQLDTVKVTGMFYSAIITMSQLMARFFHHNYINGVMVSIKLFIYNC